MAGETRISGIDKIFVLHCKSGYEDRAESIESQFANHQLAFDYILDWDVSDLTPISKKHFSPHLSDVLISLCQKHFEVMRQVVRHEYKRVVVFEDDIFLFPNFRTEMSRVVAESDSLPFPHAIYLSNSCNKYTPRSQRIRGKILYEQDHSRAADAYVLTLEVCKRRLNWLENNQIGVALDHLYCNMDRELGIKMYWVEDPICEQGSMNGRFSSSIENEHLLWVQRMRWKLDKFYKMHILRNLR